MSSNFDLSGDEYFDCDRTRCRLKRSICIRRQQKAEEQTGLTDFEPFVLCQECEQGKRIKEAHEEQIMKSKNTRICKTPDCGKTTLNSNCDLCPSCMARRANEKRKAEKELQKAEPLTPSVDIAQISQPRGDMELRLDFGRHEELLNEVSALADREFRPINLQILFMLKSYLDSTERGEQKRLETARGD